jgi:hypothetical protein
MDGIGQKCGPIPFDDVSECRQGERRGNQQQADDQWNQTTTIEENPTGMAIKCSARFRG